MTRPASGKSPHDDTQAQGPIRVAFVDHSSERGGAELALLRLLNVPRPWKPLLVVPRAPQTDLDAFADLPPGVTALRVGLPHAARRIGGTGILANLALCVRLARSALTLILNRLVRSADVLVANTTRASVYVTLTGRVLRKPVVVHVRDLINPEAVGSAATVLMRRFVMPRAAGVIANSRASLELVQPYVKTSCVTAVIPSPSGLVSSSLECSVPAPRVRRIGMVARLDPWKGQELVVRAFARALPESDEQLILFGGAAFGHDEFPAQLRGLAAELGLGERLQLAGHTDDVAAAIDSLDVCVQCSLRPEPLGQNVLQYLAAGKPTIVADEGGPSEWVKDNENGLKFAARDVDALAAILRRVCQDESLRRRLSEGARSTPGLLDDSQVALRVQSVIESVVAR